VGGGAPRNLSAAQVDHTLESYGWRPDGRLVASAMFGFRSRLLEIGTGGEAKTLLSPEMAFDTIAVSPRGEVAFAGGTATRPPELHLAEPGREVRRLSDFHAAFAGYELSRPSFVTYPSFDGLPIEAMVLAPPGAGAPRKLPTVVIPHGGPAWRFADGFQPLAQMLATTGHLVLLPNIRGSQGRSYEFMTLARSDWGGGDFRDLLAGADYLVAQGQADPYPREGHTLRERAHIRDRHQRSLDWLRKYLGTAGAPGD